MRSAAAKGGRVRAAGISIEVSIECGDEAAATALNDALMPDNRHFPKDQRFEASKAGSLVRYKVESPRARPALSTVASIISDAKLFSDVWVEAKTRWLAGHRLGTKLNAMPGRGRSDRCWT